MEPNKLTPEQEDNLIESAFQDLLDGYLASHHRKRVEIIERAFKFAKEAHKGIRRRSGEPYILHPIEVAKIANQEIGLGSTSICAALLHDVVEDTEYTVEDIEALFGSKIASFVSGLTKISGGIFGDQASAQAENFRKLLLSMAVDTRVVLLKMADRLHNMRTLGSMLPNKQYKIAGETLYIYAPLAHRLGLFAIKTELEDLSFKYEHPESYKLIGKQIAESAHHRNEVYEEFAKPIEKRLKDLGLEYEMKARVKSIYSIWNKMETKNIPFSEVYDLYAARIIFQCDNEADEKRICWSIYSEITDLYRIHPERTRDWVSSPKANEYQALHITVMGPDGNWIEVQIRSNRMNEVAERGVATHWKYKSGEISKPRSKEYPNEKTEDDLIQLWLENVKEVLKSGDPNAMDTLGTIKLNLYSAEIRVFTPKGELVILPSESSVLDFAFNLHSQLGLRCIAGKVNHKLVPLSHKLMSGDQVEILTSHSQTPQKEWLKFLRTVKAQNLLNAALRKERRQYIENGEKIFNEALEKKNVSLSDEILLKFFEILRVQDSEDLFYQLGKKDIVITDDVFKALTKTSDNIISKLLRNPFASNKTNKEIEIKDVETPKINAKKEYLLNSQNGKTNYTIAQCCHPIPGDDVLGYIDDDKSVVVHKLKCSTAMHLKSSQGGRLLSTKWDTTSEKFEVKIKLEGIDRMGILQEITQAITSTLSINIISLNIESSNGLFMCSLGVLAENTKVVKQLCKILVKINGVKSATRIND